MSSAFLSHVPVWVWGLLVALIALGVLATRPRQKTVWQALTMPLAMTAFSIFGVVSTFATNVPALIAWCSAVVITFALRAALGWWGNVRWDPETRRVHLPGSWLPLVWMLSIFAAKFTVAVAVAIHPELMTHGGFSAWVCLMYGTFSGIFLGRMLAIGRAVRRGRGDGLPDSPSMAS
ncbi:hypothetical protein PAN31117_01530 [Pandoraea anapnoica]|uniref:DUF1453 domain-containing protein n=1 Tax=Pandoraea anapnoica TaxID=2508301 RepID=A0A5E4ZSB7_9BURK|nr:DUF6622 family protein [Pandoraea anapnoica]VVE64279.1 hypothetical protein PAN31117_01530 [Pandoraea anapnoica]